jgi:hypothetical protein
MPISQDRLKELAIKGLKAELQELTEGRGQSSLGESPRPPRQKRRPMSAKERKIHSEKMKKVWAERKKSSSG